MTLYKRREKFSGLSLRLGRIFGPIGLTANNYTALALILTFVSAYFIITGNYLAAALFFAVASFFDIVDGSVARFRKEAGKKGAYFDTISDRYMEGIAAIALVLTALPALLLPSYFWASLYLFGSFMTTYAKSAAAEKGLGSVRGGLLERPDRLILLFIGMVAAHFSQIYLTAALALLAVLSNVSAFQRISAALKPKKAE